RRLGGARHRRPLLWRHTRPDDWARRTGSGARWTDRGASRRRHRANRREGTNAERGFDRYGIQEPAGTVEDASVERAGRRDDEIRAARVVGSHGGGHRLDGLRRTTVASERRERVWEPEGRSPSEETMKKTGAQIIWECLVREGVSTVFGYPGGAILPAYDAMLDYPIRHVLVRHEQGATHMADGYARASGKVGV